MIVGVLTNLLTAVEYSRRPRDYYEPAHPRLGVSLFGWSFPLCWSWAFQSTGRPVLGRALALGRNPTNTRAAAGHRNLYSARRASSHFKLYYTTNSPSVESFPFHHTDLHSEQLCTRSQQLLVTTYTQSQHFTMSHLEYTTPAGHGQDNLKNYRYNQVVRVGDVLHISGQGASRPSSLPINGRPRGPRKRS